MFGTDNYADIGNLPVLRHDNGADAYEVAHYMISEYEDRYLFDDYRRNRTSSACATRSCAGTTATTAS